MNQSAVDVGLLLVFGAVGFVVGRFGIPILPLILGVIIGPLMETKLREALDVSNGAISGLFNEPLAVFVHALIVLALVDKRYLGAEGKVTLEERLVQSGVAHEVRQTMGRDVADEILSVATDVGADAIVIGIRHRTPVGKLLMGSVAQRIIIDAACPVIAVKPG